MHTDDTLPLCYIYAISQLDWIWLNLVCCFVILLVVICVYNIVKTVIIEVLLLKLLRDCYYLSKYVLCSYWNCTDIALTILTRLNEELNCIYFRAMDGSGVHRWRHLCLSTILCFAAPATHIRDIKKRGYHIFQWVYFRCSSTPWWVSLLAATTVSKLWKSSQHLRYIYYFSRYFTTALSYYSKYPTLISWSCWNIILSDSCLSWCAVPAVSAVSRPTTEYIIIVTRNSSVMLCVVVLSCN